MKTQEDNDYRNSKLPNNLLQLQNLIKRHKDDYVAEFMQQYRHFQALLDVFRLQPTLYSDDFAKIVMFLAQVSPCYPKQLQAFPQQLMDLLKEYSTLLDRDMRLSLCRALIMMRNRGLLSPSDLLELFFQLLNCRDKVLRKFLREHLVADIESANARRRSVRMNSSLQNFMFSMLKSGNPTAAKVSLYITTTLFRRRVWHDAKTVNIVASALFSKQTKVMVAALEFFLHYREDKKKKLDDSDEDDDDKKPSAPTPQDIVRKNHFNKKTRKRKAKLEKVKKLVDQEKKEAGRGGDGPAHFSALHLINDPQSVAEDLLKFLTKMTQRFEVNLMVFDLVSRLIGVHQLFLFNFYPLVQRFLRPRHREVTKLLLYAAHAAHGLVPPEVIEPVVRTIANNFVADGNHGDVIAVGLNAIREICLRCPLAMTAELLHDLSRYKRNKIRSISSAANSLIHVFRVANPELLPRKDRGKPTLASSENQVLRYGESGAVDYIPGAETVDKGGAAADGDADDDADAVSDSEASDAGDREIGLGDFEGDPALKDLAPQERVQKAKAASQNRILTQKDFRAIKVAQISKKMAAAPRKGSAKKRNAAMLEGPLDPFERQELPTLDDVQMIHGKKRKLDKEAMAAARLAEREARPKLGAKKRMNPHASTTNREKRKNKAFMMVLPKAKQKLKRSFQEKARLLRKVLLKSQNKS